MGTHSSAACCPPNSSCREEGREAQRVHGQSARRRAAAAPTPEQPLALNARAGAHPADGRVSAPQLQLPCLHDLLPGKPLGLCQLLRHHLVCTSGKCICGRRTRRSQPAWERPAAGCAAHASTVAAPTSVAGPRHKAAAASWLPSVAPPSQPTLVVVSLAQLVAGAKAPQPGVAFHAEAACRAGWSRQEGMPMLLHEAWARAGSPPCRGRLEAGRAGRFERACRTAHICTAPPARCPRKLDGCLVCCRASTRRRCAPDTARHAAAPATATPSSPSTCLGSGQAAHAGGWSSSHCEPAAGVGQPMAGRWGCTNPTVHPGSHAGGPHSRQGPCC